MTSAKRSRCFFDVTVDGEFAGRITFELYNDIVPTTAQNFVKLCTGEAGIGKTTGKPLTFKGSLFHRVVKNFMIQGGDFSACNGTGGESIYGSVFEDENFIVRHDQPFILSMANRGPNTNGSQFFITTNPAPHLDNVHVAFGRVVSGQDVVTRIEQLKVGAKSRPICDVVVSACGQLIKKKSDSADEDEENVTKSKKHKKHKHKDGDDNEDGKEENKNREKETKKDDHYSSVKAEDLPQVPETNNFLMRRGSPKNVDDRRRSNRSRSPRNRPKVKGRGRLLYQSPSRDGSSTPPHWKREADRLIPMNKLKKIQDEQKKLAAKMEEEEAVREKELQVRETYGYSTQPVFEDRRGRDERRDRDERHAGNNVRLHNESSSNRQREEKSRNEDRYQERRPRNHSVERSGRNRSVERNDRRRNEQKNHNEEKMEQYEKRRQRRPSDIEREKYRKGELANIKPIENKPPVPANPYLNYSQMTFQNGASQQSYVTDPIALAAMAVAYAKNATANYSLSSIPAGHYSSTKEVPKKAADLPDSYVIETETPVKPLDDSWDKDHGKRTKRVHEVIENERIIIPPRTDPTAKKSRRDSPPRKDRRHEERSNRRDNKSPVRRRSRSRDDRRKKRHRNSSSSSSSSPDSRNRSKRRNSAEYRRR